MSYLTCVVLVWFHVQAVAALWQFTWTNLFVALFLYWVAIGLGISMGYHRLHTHRGFKTSKLFEYFLAVCGTLTLEGGPIFWVATHRQHHQHSDQALDPHTPRVNGFWAHIGWILFGEAHHNDTALMSRYAPDLAKDPFYRWLTTYHWVPLTVLGFTLLAIGGWPLVNWAIFLRVVVGLHATWLVNSATHMWGRRRFATKDDSKQHLVGGAADVRRRLAQQPPRAPDVGAPRPGLVRVRPHLARAEAPQGARAGLGRQGRPYEPGHRGRDRRLAPFAAILEGVRRA